MSRWGKSGASLGIIAAAAAFLAWSAIAAPAQRAADPSADLSVVVTPASQTVRTSLGGEALDGLVHVSFALTNNGPDPIGGAIGDLAGPLDCCDWTGVAVGETVTRQLTFPGYDFRKPGQSSAWVGTYSSGWVYLSAFPAAGVAGSMSDPNLANNKGDFSVTFVPVHAAKVSLAVSSTVGTLEVGHAAQYVFVSAAKGPDRTTDLTADFTIPGSIRVTEATSDPAGRPCTIGAQVVHCRLDDEGDGETARIFLTVVPLHSGVFEIHGALGMTSVNRSPRSGDGSPTAALSATATANADLAVQGSSTPASVVLGALTHYLLTVKNTGPDPAESVSLDATLPAGALLSATPSQGSCSGSGPVTCSLDDIATGAAVTVDIGLITSVVGPAVVHAAVRAGDPDPVAANNAADVSVTVSAPPTKPVVVKPKTPATAKTPAKAKAKAKTTAKAKTKPKTGATKPRKH
jgi:uncharacterized repeat protein (TIGR01451 family)